MIHAKCIISLSWVHRRYADLTAALRAIALHTWMRRGGARPRSNFIRTVLSINLFYLFFFLAEHHCVRVHSRVSGERAARVHGLQTRRAPWHQPRVPIVSVSIRTHNDPARHIQT